MGKRIAFVMLTVLAVFMLVAASASAPSSSDLKRYLTTDSANSAFALTAGVQTRATISGAGSPLHVLGVQNGVRTLKVKLIPFGAGSDNTTFDYRVYVGYLMRQVSEQGEPTNDLCKLALYGFGTVTLGTKTGDGTIVGSTDRYGDTITWNVAGNATATVGVGEAIELAGNVISDKYSPADNTEAMLFIPSTGEALYLVIDFDLTGATGANFLVSVEG